MGLLSMQPVVFAQTCQFTVDPGSSPGGGKYNVCIQLSNAADDAPFKAVFDMVLLAGFLTILTLPMDEAFAAFQYLSLPALPRLPQRSLFICSSCSHFSHADARTLAVLQEV